MKKIVQIARLELCLLFYSPIAWLLIMVLFVHMSHALIPGIAQIRHLQEFIPGFSFLTERLFTSSSSSGNISQGVFFSILGKLYLYTPLITMGIISRENSSGSIKLLFSSPVKLSHIVYGKFAAMLVFNLVIAGLMGLFFIAGSLSVDHFDYPYVLVAILASFLLLSAYSAIGIFMSSLTTYQVVAAICTFAVLAFMNYVGNFGQGLDFVRDLTHSLSMPSRAERMVGGLLSSRDVIYYIAVSGIFLGFTIAKLELGRVSRSFVYQTGRYTAVLVVGLAVAYLSSRQRVIVYYDATATKANTIVKATQEILRKMGDEPVEMTAYINGLHYTYENAAPVNRIFSIAQWEPYLRFKPNINLHWVYYYDSFDPQLYAVNPGKSLKTMFAEKAKSSDIDTAGFLSPAQIRKQIDLRGENDRVVIQLKYKGKTTFLRTFDGGNIWPKEEEVAAALKRLIVTPPKIVFSTDGYQRSVDKIGDRDYKQLFNTKLSRNSLINTGFDIDSVSLEHGQIPAGIATLVIADPKVAFSPAALAKLHQYIAEGGNLMIAGEPGKQVVLNPLLDSLGVKMLDGTLVQHSRDFSYGLVTPNLTAAAVKMAPLLKSAFMEKKTVSMPGTAALAELNSGAFDVQPLLMTNAKTSWIKKGAFVLDSAALVVEKNKGDQPGAFPAVLLLSRKVNHKQQRIIVSGDADFFSNKELGRTNMETVNGFFAVNLFSWFSNDEFPVDMVRPESKDTTLKLSKAGVKTLQISYYLMIPGTILLLGAILLIRRKRK
ncbi:Gldg family protein [Pedobacter caeni]|uniref:ABC-2 type transport system permease protein n=1 Tax=Pedobacter caeni TaxID=288992 RepID=A0A1M5DEB5_9SPHI|nr:Gldg family protein [Pedobacter caeni]SHF65266.1 ABC-2 type transport system permease protein [Pedobacter caeni]